MNVVSLHCPNCGGPLPVKPEQTLAACVYCNSTIRIVPAAAAERVVTQVVEVAPEVIDEVKRLLVLGQRMPAAEYYARAAGISQAEAETAVQAIEKRMAHFPPLSGAGIVMLVTFDLIGLAGVLAGAALVNRGQWPVGVVLFLAGAFFMLGNSLVFLRGLRGYLLVKRGRPASAEILKVWLIRTTKAGQQPVDLSRLMLRVCPPGEPAYNAEANVFISGKSRPKFQVGSMIRVKYDPLDRARVVVTGAGQ